MLIATLFTLIRHWALAAIGPNMIELYEIILIYILLQTVLKTEECFSYNFKLPVSTLIKSQFKFKKSKKEIYKRLLESLKSFQVWSESKEKYPRRPLANLGVGGLLRIAANFLGIRVLKWSLIKNSF